MPPRQLRRRGEPLLPRARDSRTPFYHLQASPGIFRHSCSRHLQIFGMLTTGARWHRDGGRLFFSRSSCSASRRRRVFAQVTGSIAGTIRDESGAVLPGRHGHAHRTVVAARERGRDLRRRWHLSHLARAARHLYRVDDAAGLHGAEPRRCRRRRQPADHARFHARGWRHHRDRAGVGRRAAHPGRALGCHQRRDASEPSMRCR